MNSSNTSLGCFVFIALLLVPRAFAQVGSGAVEELDRTYQAWVRAANSRDIDAWASFLDDDPFFAPPNHPALESRDRILEFYSDLFNDPQFVRLDCVQAQAELSRSGDFAWTRGTCVAVFIDENAAEVLVPSKWTKVWRRTDAGEWRCRHNTWNLDS